MGARFRSILVVAIILVVVIAFIFGAYRFGWSGTGFLNKTLWDWLQLLIIPLVLAIAALLFNRATTRTEQQIAAKRYEQDQEIAAKRYEQDQEIAAKRYEQDQEIAAKRYEQDQEIALDKQREDLLQAYLDRMSELLLEKSLATSPSEEARNVARVRTITILFQLDTRRIEYVFAFLRESGLTSAKPNGSIVSLNKVRLEKVDLSGASLPEVDLSGAYLIEAYLSGANLSGANLSGAYLNGATLYKANLRGANLYKASLYDANLGGANLREANLREAGLRGADLSGASLGLTDLRNTYLGETNFSGADLGFDNTLNVFGDNLTAPWDNMGGAILEGATGITIEKLEKQAKSLKGATMPDGSIHE